MQTPWRRTSLFVYTQLSIGNLVVQNRLLFLLLLRVVRYGLTQKSTLGKVVWQQFPSLLFPGDHILQNKQYWSRDLLLQLTWASTAEASSCRQNRLTSVTAVLADQKFC